MENILSYFENASALQWAIVGTILFAVWFLPAAVALIFNRKHFKLILVACVPAGFSVIAWSGLMIWATTGNIVDKARGKSVLASKAAAESKIK
ncbi:superinfection immunity protein [Aliiglaciecola sp. LCG003]|uniref:superinfection immunity protein n=1 Tax=Aliiglaciecola sp. LCG003 TaxID=3053655 RepID=UPI002572600C|nr:superinfection immunity protein [Aliiglaciecola sp. LCG003]WJG11108.1 superinfection immunity protein [Aliiglaciecola sp. LCG003]